MLLKEGIPVEIYRRPKGRKGHNNNKNFNGIYPPDMFEIRFKNDHSKLIFFLEDLSNIDTKRENSFTFYVVTDC